MPAELTVNLVITTVRDGMVFTREDRVVRETPFALYVNGEKLTTLLCTPADLDRLALGFLCSEGLLVAREELISLRVREAEGVIAVELHGETAARVRKVDCRPVQSDLVVTPAQLFTLVERFKQLSPLFEATGGVHSAALANNEKILYFYEDIGRHNTVDKIVGACFLDQVSPEDKILLSSGRLGSEIVIKAARLGLPVLVSRSAPTSLSIELAREGQITLIGFARERRLNVYTHPDRLRTS